MLVMRASLKSTRSASQSVSEIRLACLLNRSPTRKDSVTLWLRRALTGLPYVKAATGSMGRWHGNRCGVALAVALAWWTHNRLMALDERCATAFADVDV